MQKVLEKCDWRINGRGNAAERLGIHPNTLRFRMKKLGVSREVTAAP
jgi:sugar diacid utilization regulator